MIDLESLKNKGKNQSIYDYEKYNICNFIIYAENGLFDKYPGLIHILNFDLTTINNLVPSGALRMMQNNTKIFINDNYLYYNYPKQSGDDDDDDVTKILPIYKPPESMCFHPGGDWLVEHGNIRDKTECVEMYRCRGYMKDRGYMPMVLLHELGHSYHWYIGFDNEIIKNAYENVKNSKDKLYENIPFVLGGNKRAYALTNCMEYFSELTECYFGLNDFYPFNKKELKEYDPLGYNMCQKIWNLTTKEIEYQHKQALKRREKEKEKETEEEERKNVGVGNKVVVDERPAIVINGIVHVSKVTSPRNTVVCTIM